MSNLDGLCAGGPAELIVYWALMGVERVTVEKEDKEFREKLSRNRNRTGH